MKKIQEKIYYNRHIYYFILFCLGSAFLFDWSGKNNYNPNFWNIVVIAFFLSIFAYLSKDLLEKFEKRHIREKEDEEIKRIKDKNSISLGETDAPKSIRNTGA
ncbi:MAG: hypothetical protein HYV51_01825 [Parcubacteria group bacterium]|nr:hypothetical protein [Parcubacteria group bacterium]